MSKIVDRLKEMMQEIKGLRAEELTREERIALLSAEAGCLQCRVAVEVSTKLDGIIESLERTKAVAEGLLKVIESPFQSLFEKDDSEGAE